MMRCGYVRDGKEGREREDGKGKREKEGGVILPNDNQTSKN